jgi:hypothetical protein
METSAPIVDFMKILLERGESVHEGSQTNIICPRGLYTIEHHDARVLSWVQAQGLMRHGISGVKQCQCLLERETLSLAACTARYRRCPQFLVFRRSLNMMLAISAGPTDDE